MAVADGYPADRVQVFHPNGTFAYQLGSRGEGPGEFMALSGVAFGPGGIMAVADYRGHRVQVFHPPPAAPPPPPVEPARNPSTAGAALALEFGSLGSGAGQFMAARDVAFGPGGIMAVADAGNHRVQVFYPNGTYAFALGELGEGRGEFHRPGGLAFGPGGLLAVSDMGNSRVQVFRIE